MNMLPSRVFFDDLFDDLDKTRFTNLDNMMKCDIYEKDGEYNIEVDVPGFNKEDIKMKLADGYITITAEHNEEEKEEEDKKYIRRERKYSSRCERKFYVGDIDENEVKAKFKDGTLKIVVPKEKEKAPEKFIDIN